MTAAAWLQVAILILLLAISTPLRGSYMAKVYGGTKAPGDRVFRPVENGIFRMCRVDPRQRAAGGEHVCTLAVGVQRGVGGRAVRPAAPPGPSPAQP